LPEPDALVLYVTDSSSAAQKSVMLMFRSFVATDCFGAPIPNGSSWSIAGTRFAEMFATLLPVGSWLPTAALEQADRKSLGLESLHCRNSRIRQFSKKNWENSN
jgi:hypothetical protein